MVGLLASGVVGDTAVGEVDDSTAGSEPEQAVTTAINPVPAAIAMMSR